ncbi:hypothetical protein C7476_113108 [Phyllobacterium bourgognense]|uniref:Uncharacterized protein n=1 Tax=Phyllobacterium bourgognense TaxID=314236 RepID=A0A368YKE7_9HYPH|nr:hypothetical protein C7476_113108 [Phyllobacterium bourgognense]
MPAEVFFRIFPSSTSLNYLIFGLSVVRGHSLSGIHGHFLSVILGLDPRTHWELANCSVDFLF